MERLLPAYLIVLLLLVSGSVLGFGMNVTGTVVNVIDGNTVEVITTDNQKVIVILAEIDCPELTQDHGNEAKRFLEKLALKKEVIVELRGKDRKGNTLGVLLIKGKTDARVALLQHGLAWTAERNPNPELEIHKTSAQAERKGLWKTENPTPPWIHRREQSMLQPKES